MNDPVKSIEVFSLTTERETPYLGPLAADETPNERGYFVRAGNRTVYPVFDRSVLVRMETRAGVVGWGETYGLVAPGAIGEIINDLLSGFTVGRDPSDPATIHDDLYDLMRVRGYTGGFLGDALAAIDIALWDIAGRQAGRAVADLLGDTCRIAIPAYVSGLPEATRAARTRLAAEWQALGFESFKFATPVAGTDPPAELASLREALGPDARIAVDMHWAYAPDEAIAMIEAMAPDGPWFAEAPVATEDFSGLAQVAESSSIPIAVGEEWRTEFDMRQRVERCRIGIVQPEMGHTGFTRFVRIGELAAAHGIEVIPHATVGIGVFLAASLQASTTLPTLVAHEFQHSIFEPNRHLLHGGMDCAEGYYVPPTGPGIGVEPSEEALGLLKRL